MYEELSIKEMKGLSRVGKDEYILLHKTNKEGSWKSETN